MLGQAFAHPEAFTMAPPIPSPLPPLIRWSNTRNSYTYQFNTSDICDIKYTGCNILKVIMEGHSLDTTEFYDNNIEHPRVHFTAKEDLPINQPSPITSTSHPSFPPAVAFTAPPPVEPIAPETMSTHHNKIKVNKPEPFDGDQSKYHSFMISTSLYLATVPNLSDGERIAFVLSYLTTGHALMWRDHFVEQDMKKVTVFEDFNNLLDLTFKDTNAEAKATLKLHQLKQKTKTCDEYTAEFKALITEAGIIGDPSLIQFYQDGLNASLLDRCWGIIPTPLTLKGWISNASQLDLAYRHRQAQKQGLTSAFRRSSNCDSNAMDVDRKKSNGVRLRKLTPDE